MSSDQRPTSPFMLGTYYKIQMTSLMSLKHRATGVLLSVLGLPMLLWWISAISSGEQAYQAMLACYDGWLGKLALIAVVLSLFYHLFNGIRHLIWDTGRMLDMTAATRAGWVVITATLVTSAGVLWRLL